MAWPLSDSFTNTNGTTLPTHNAAWVQHASWAAATMRVYNNRASASASGSTVYRYNDAPSSADYEVSADIHQVTNGATLNSGVMARLDSSAATGYMARYRPDTGTQLFKFVGSTSAVQLGSTVAGAIANFETLALKLSVNGSTIKVFKNGSEVISVTDTAITAAGFAGVWTSASDITGCHIDNFAAAALSGGGGSSIPAISKSYRNLRA